MTSKLRFFMIAALTLMFGVFVGTTAAQDTTAAPKQDGVQSPDKFERRGKFGRDGAGPGFRGPGRGPEAMLREFRDLNLTDTQKQQIHTILESNKPDQATIDQMNALRDARKSGTELTADQKQQLKTLRQQQGEKMRSVHEQILNVLTPEQKQQLEQKRQEMRQKWEQRQQQQQAAPKTDKPASEKPTN